MMTLDLAIATYKPEGIERVKKLLLPPMEGVRYIVSWQEHENSAVPESLLLRDDVEVHRFDLRGISNNRNNAIKHCHGDLVLIADDDIIYNENVFDKVISLFENNPEWDMALFKIKYSKPKRYPDNNEKISVPFPKGYYGSAVEISFRREKSGGLKFWKEIGPGNNFLQAGEDELFLISAIKRGLEVRFADIELGKHVSLTTGDKISPGILRGQGYIIRQIYPYSFALRFLLKSLRLWKTRKTSFISSLRFLVQGSRYKGKQL